MIKKYIASLVVLGAGLCLFGASSAHAQYVIDDGTAEDSYAFGNGVMNVGSVWLNEFSVLPGANTIGSISIAFGDPTGVAAGYENVAGLPMQALIYSDPNGDGSPADGMLLGSVSGTIQNVGTNTFTTYTFSSPITVSTANFFVGYYVPGFTNPNGQQYFAAIDMNGAMVNSNRSFIFANTDGTEPDINNPSDNQFLSSNAAAGITGNWLVRANAVPEPSTWAMIGLGGALLLGLMRYRTRLS